MEEYEPGSIRTYLMQMGDIPLLSRREELATAQRIEQTRRTVRRSILESDYVLRGFGRSGRGAYGPHAA